MGKVVKGIGKAIKKIKPLKLIGGLAKGASKIAGFVPGIGTAAGALLGGGGALLSGEGIGGALKGAASGALPGIARGLAGKAGGGFIGKLAKGASKFLGGRGLPGSTGSLGQQLLTAVPGVIGAINKGKQQGRQNRLLQSQADIFGDIARTGRGLVDEAAPLRRGANAAIMARLSAGRPSMDFASDRLNPFTPNFNPNAPPPLPAGPPELPMLPRRRRRLALPAAGGTSGTPYLNAAVQ